jgi:hypothetical protein
MSSWPLISHFASMLKNPQVGFRDPELKQCSVEMNQLGQPKARSGNFATVYRGFRPDGSEFAIRVFNRRQDERLEHYRTISDYLENRSISSIVALNTTSGAFVGRGRQAVSAADDGMGSGDHAVRMDARPLPRGLCRGVADRRRRVAAPGAGTGRERCGPWRSAARQRDGFARRPFQAGRLRLHVRPGADRPPQFGDGSAAVSAPGAQRRHVLFPGPGQFLGAGDLRRAAGTGRGAATVDTYVDQPEYDRILFRDEDFRTPACRRCTATCSTRRTNRSAT